MKRRTLVVLSCIAGIGTLQAALWLAYRAVNESRGAPADISWEKPELRAPMHAKLLTSDGRATTLAAVGPSRPRLLHFWATWCAPCQEELPTLLELASDRASGLELVLVSLDKDWRPVEAFFEGAVPDVVVRDGGELASALQISALPDTYLLAPDGAPLARFHGPRDWSAPELKAELGRLLAAAPR